MVIVIGRIRGRPDDVERMVALSLEHVRRSRAEPGCVSHSVHHDAEDPLTLVFVETWTDRAALVAHFAVPASGQFVRDATALAVTTPTIDVYDATSITV